MPVSAAVLVSAAVFVPVPVPVPVLVPAPVLVPVVAPVVVPVLVPVAVPVAVPVLVPVVVPVLAPVPVLEPGLAFGVDWYQEFAWLVPSKVMLSEIDPRASHSVEKAKKAIYHGGSRLEKDRDPSVWGKVVHGHRDRVARGNPEGDLCSPDRDRPSYPLDP